MQYAQHKIEHTPIKSLNHSINQPNQIKSNQSINPINQKRVTARLTVTQKANKTAHVQDKMEPKRTLKSEI